MSNSILNILPNTPPQPPPPPAQSDQNDDGAFSSELQRVQNQSDQSAPAQQTAPTAPKPPVNPKGKKSAGKAVAANTNALTTKAKPAPGSQTEEEPQEIESTAVEVQTPPTQTSETPETPATPETQEQSETTEDPKPKIAARIAKAPAALPDAPTANLQIATAVDPKSDRDKTKSDHQDSPDDSDATSVAAAGVAAAGVAVASAQTAPATTAANPTATENAEIAVDSMPVQSNEPSLSLFKASPTLATATAQTANAKSAVASSTSETAGAANATSDLDSQLASSIVIDSNNFSSHLAAASHNAHAVATAPLPVAQSAVAQFSEANQPTIVSTIHGDLLPGGGTMSINLNPPDLGAMQVTVHVNDGVISASFQTSTDQATRMLTHSLSQLKMALETQGVSVDRLHVQQTSSSSNSSSSSSDDEGSNQSAAYDSRNAQQEQLRKQMLRRMWEKVAGNDPLDMVA